MAHEFICTMHRVRKVHPPDREVIKGMTLAFYPGAKIGVIGLNGSGKSTLLKIMARVETEIDGEVWHPDGIRIGYLPQEPLLDESLDVRGNVEQGVAGTRALLERYEALNARLCEELDEDAMNAVLAEVADVQDAIEAAGAWELDRTVETAMEALRCPPPDADP
jgi:sulfate-transporting ATPase